TRHRASAKERHRLRSAIYRRPGERDPGNSRRNVPYGDGLEAGYGKLGHVHALAILGPLPGTERQGRNLRLREVQLRDADHEAGRHGTHGIAQSRHEQLSALLYAQGFPRISVGLEQAETQLPLGLPQSFPQERLGAEVLRPRTRQILGSTVSQEGGFRLRHHTWTGRARTGRLRPYDAEKARGEETRRNGDHPLEAVIHEEGASNGARIGGSRPHWSEFNNAGGGNPPRRFG